MVASGALGRTQIIALSGGPTSWNEARKNFNNAELSLKGIDIRAIFEATEEVLASDRVYLDGIDLSGLDLSDARLMRCDFRGASFDRSDLEGVDFSGSNLLGASLRGATLTNAAMLGTDVGEANLIGANLHGVRLARGKLAQVKAAFADFSGASLRNADLYCANFRSANLREADLRGADLRETDLRGAMLEKCDVRTIPVGTARAGLRAEFTDLSSVRGLTQQQLETMIGDRSVILPNGLTYPDHWKEIALSVAGKAPIYSSKEALSGHSIRKNMSKNSPGIALGSIALLGQLRLLREQVFTLNQLAAEHPEERDEIVDFIDSMTGQTYEVLAKLPHHQGEPTNDDDELEGFFSQYFSSASDGFGRIMDPKKLGSISAPAVTVLAFGTVGFLISGLNPIGFGAGSLFGRWIAQDMKLGDAAKKIEDIMESEDGEALN